jgi:type I restriction enzyme M protein
MLDADTKRRIDGCRDILVGKVPDPKSQVEQITIALIYKFMDDMDAEAEELGGKRTFFAGDYARYGWAKLMAPSLGGFEVLALYSEAIATMRENPGVPELFRDIFKNAYLPYRDPETLKSFLKEINHFTYDHSERLGDAFEYLLSVLGSQGDAGQFRTPRHIIDFMVEVMDPKKHESILDPACGTAGFLISAWKHIFKANTRKTAGDKLTPDERARLASNIKGYDISPDMVRLSLVNLYLHGFSDPHVVEYDTLTQDDKWNEVADVILANPPFMSPKGGIKPHKRFSVQATRSEVLFVDYMAEHLSATGRAAIVVPEGIIFQSGTAYKALRKMLVDTSLVAVVSLPAGVFNPYSGVKTSILILDKRVHKQTDKVLFVKVQNDGFNLGAQRRAVVNSDLPEATRLLRDWRAAPEKFESDGAMAQAVERSKIGAGGDFNLSGERYVVGAVATSSYKFVELGEVVDILDSRRRPITKSDRVSGPYPYYGATGVLDHVHDFLFDEPLVLIGEDGAKWESGDKTAFAVSGKTWVNNHAHVVRPQRDKLLDVYLIEMLRQMDLSPYITGVTVPKLNQEKLRGIQFPLPPLEVQHQIVAEIEGYQKIIDGARQVLDNYKPHIAINSDWPVVELDEIAEFKNGLNYDADGEGQSIKIFGVSNFKDHLIAPVDDLPDTQVNGMVDASYLIQEGDILFVRSNGNPALVGRSVLIPALDTAITFSGFTIRCRFKTEVEPYFYACLFKSTLHRELFRDAGQGASIRNLSQGMLKEVKVPLPDLATQRAIVAEIEAEQALVAANRELIRRMEAKVKAAIDRVWGQV